MLILGREQIGEAIKKHSDWRASVNSWVRITTAAMWKDFADVRKTVSSASWVKKRVVFNIAHGKARLVSQIVFDHQKVIILNILSHPKYDKWSKS